MARFVFLALPLVILLLAAFGAVVGVLDLEPRSGSVIRLALFEQPRVPATVVLGAWLMESCGLLALFLIAQGRCGAWWLDGLVAGWLAWVFRGPLLVLTVVVATRQPQGPWWRLALAWFVLYSIIGLALGWLAGDSETRSSEEVDSEDDGPEDEASQDEASEREGAEPDDSVSGESVPGTVDREEADADGGPVPGDAGDGEGSPEADQDSEDRRETRRWVEAYDSGEPAEDRSTDASPLKRDP